MSQSQSFSDLALDFPEYALDEGQIIIWSDGLLSCEETLEHLKHRMKYHGETPTLEQIDNLLDSVRQVTRTARGDV